MNRLGKFGGSYFKQEVFDFFKVAQDHWQGKFKVLLLSNYPKEEIERWARNSGFPLSAIVQAFVPHEEVAKYMALADFAITPFVPVPSKRYGSPIKTGEYMAMGLPIAITPNISDDSDLIEGANAGAIIHSLDVEGYTKAIQKIDQILSQTTPKVLQAKIRNIALQYKHFDRAREVYQEVYGAGG